MFEYNTSSDYSLTKSTSIMDGKYMEYAPSSCFLPFIKKYYSIEGFQSLGGVKTKPIPKETIEMHFNYGNEGIKVLDSSGEVFQRKQSFIIGSQPISKLYQSQIVDSVSMFTIEFSYIGLNRLLNIYSAELSNRIIDVDEILGAAGEALTNRILNATNNCQRIEIIEDFFYRSLFKEYLPDRNDRLTMQFLDAHPGSSVKEMCEQLNVDRRYIERVFSKRIGVSPKEYLKIIRFNKACALLGQFPQISISDIIHDCHYYDQSHFIREFKQLAKNSPLNYIKKVDGLLYLGRGYIL